MKTVGRWLGGALAILVLAGAVYFGVQKAGQSLAEAIPALPTIPTADARKRTKGYRRSMTEILVTSLGSDLYRVEIREGDSNSIHDVTVTPNYLRAFGEGHSPQELLEESFRFLLEREPKEAILPRFELPVIARYFADYPTEISRRLTGR